MRYDDRVRAGVAAAYELLYALAAPPQTRGYRITNERTAGASTRSLRVG